MGGCFGKDNESTPTNRPVNHSHNNHRSQQQHASGNGVSTEPNSATLRPHSSRGSNCSTPPQHRISPRPVLPAQRITVQSAPPDHHSSSSNSATTPASSEKTETCADCGGCLGSCSCRGKKKSEHIGGNVPTSSPEEYMHRLQKNRPAPLPLRR